MRGELRILSAALGRIAHGAGQQFIRRRQIFSDDGAVGLERCRLGDASNGEPIMAQIVKRVLGYDTSAIASALIGYSNEISTYGRGRALFKDKIEKQLRVQTIGESRRESERWRERSAPTCSKRSGARRAA